MSGTLTFPTAASPRSTSLTLLLGLGAFESAISGWSSGLYLVYGCFVGLILGTTCSDLAVRLKSRGRYFLKMFGGYVDVFLTETETDSDVIGRRTTAREPGCMSWAGSERQESHGPEPQRTARAFHTVVLVHGPPNLDLTAGSWPTNPLW